MKVTYSWLREYVPLAPPVRLAEQLTLAGLEVESVAPVAPAFSGVRVGQVLESGRHPNAEKLSLCIVTTDGKNRLQIVCGAPNVRAGLKVAVATGRRAPAEERRHRCGQAARHRVERHAVLGARAGAGR